MPMLIKDKCYIYSGAFYLLCRWFMPINIGLTFICGGILGWIVIKVIKPKPHLEGLIMAMCSTGKFRLFKMTRV